VGKGGGRGEGGDICPRKRETSSWSWNIFYAMKCRRKKQKESKGQ